MKVVPNDNFKFGNERVKQMTTLSPETRVMAIAQTPTKPYCDS